MAQDLSPAPAFSFLRTLKLGSFHIGSALADILVSGVWNRILISNLGISATPVAFLAALRYFIAPLTIWIGYRSDTKPLFGYRRLSYIYIGRLCTWLSLPLLPLVIFQLAIDRTSVVGWLLALVIFLLYGLGTLISGAPFLALVRESAPPAKKGLAVVIVQTVLLFGFAIVPISYSILMKEYTPAGFWRLVALAMGGAALAWFLSVWGEEREGEGGEGGEGGERKRRGKEEKEGKAGVAALAAREGEEGASEPSAPDFVGMVRSILSQPNSRYFFWLLSMGAIALFAQDAILEPFGADLFGLDVGATTRFNAYYGTGVLLAMMVGSYLTRDWLPQSYTRVTGAGLLGVAGSLAVLMIAALGQLEALLVPALVAFGLASGVYTVGGLSLMIAMTDDTHAGIYLGVWSMAQLVFRGVGIFLGGLVRDLGILITGSPSIAYAAVFGMEIIAALVAVALLARLSRLGYLYTPEGMMRPTSLDRYEE